MSTHFRNGAHGTPPRRLKSRYKSLKPSHGAIAFRWGGCSMAAQYCTTPSHELPAMPTAPLHQSYWAACSMMSWQSSPGDKESETWKIKRGHTGLLFAQTYEDFPRCQRNLEHWDREWHSLAGTIHWDPGYVW